MAEMQTKLHYHTIALGKQTAANAEFGPWDIISVQVLGENFMDV